MILKLGLRIWTYAVMIFLVAPIALLIPMSLNPGSLGTLSGSVSLRWYREIFTDPTWMRSFWLSVGLAFASAVISTVAGVAAGLAMVRGRWRWQTVAYMAVLAPLIVPSVVAAAAMYLFFVRIGLDGTGIAIALGQAALALPVAVIIVSATLRGFDERLETAALSLGASRGYALRKVTLPIILPGLASAWAFSFLASFDELMVALFLSSPELETLPVHIWSSVLYEIEPTVAAISVVIIAMMVLGWGATQVARAVRSRAQARITLPELTRVAELAGRE